MYKWVINLAIMVHEFLHATTYLLKIRFTHQLFLYVYLGNGFIKKPFKTQAKPFTNTLMFDPVLIPKASKFSINIVGVFMFYQQPLLL